jgi:hypothetical protein
MTFKANTKISYADADSYAWIQSQNHYSEVIEKFGMDIYFLSKEMIKESIFINAWEDALYQVAYSMKLIKEEIIDFGNSDMFTKFGFASNDNLTFYGTIAQFELLNLKPKRGDLIFCPTIGNKIFEISHADRETPKFKYQFDRVPIAYQLQTNLYKPDMLYDYSGNTDVNKTNLINTKEIENKNTKQENQIVDNGIIKTTRRDPLLD